MAKTIHYCIGLHAQLFSLAVLKVAGGEGRPGRIYHVMRAAADVAYCSQPVAIGLGA